MGVDNFIYVKVLVKGWIKMLSREKIFFKILVLESDVYGGIC